MRPSLLKLFLLCVFFSSIQELKAQVNVNTEIDQHTYYPLENGIPVGSLGKITSDLTYEGEPVTASQILKINKEDWGGALDYSTLIPQEFTYWKRVFKKTVPQNSITLKENDTVRYLKPGVLVQEESSIHVSRNGKVYEVLMSPTNYRSAMMRNLLIRLGYYIPDLLKLNRVRVDFANAADKQAFIEHYNWVHNLELEDDILDLDGEIEEVQTPEVNANQLVKDKWIYHNPPNKNWVILRDVLIRDSEDAAYANLALEPFEEPEIQNRRTLNSLLIPYSILNFTGSVNTLEWWAGREESQNIFLDYPSAPQFEMSYDDARWMLRRMGKLTHDDWVDIVRSSKLPGTIQKIITEKFISRYNSLVALFKLGNPILPVNYQPNHNIELVKGKLERCEWDSNAIEFCGGNNDMGIQSTDLWGFIKSKAFSTVLNTAVGVVNIIPGMGTDISGTNSSILEKTVLEAIERYENDGTETNILAKGWNFKYHNFNLIFSRNLVAGRYQGSEQLLNQVDSIGISLSIGNYFAKMGYNPDLESGSFYHGDPTKPFLRNVNVTPLSVKVAGSISRVYSHVSPVFDIHTANKKLPFKESIVPLIKNKLGRLLNDSKKAKGSDKFYEIALQDLKEFKQQFRIGESFIITDRVSADAAAGVTATYHKLAELSVGGGGGYTVINRLHITRVSENTLHVYKNLGNMANVNFSTAISSFNFPVFSFGVSGIPKGAKARTRFYSLSLDEDSPWMTDNILAIRSLMVSGSLKSIKRVAKPIKLKFNFNQKIRKIGVFWFNFNKINSGNLIKIDVNKTDSKLFYRYYEGRSRGVNYFNYGAKVVESILLNQLDINAPIAENSLNPGLNFTGKSNNKEFIYEMELDKDKKPMEHFAHLSLSRNGWKIKPKKMTKLIHNIEQGLGFDYFPENVMHDATQVQLYHLGVSFFVYDQGLAFLQKLTKNQVKQIVTRFSQNDIRPDVAEGIASGIITYNKRFQKFIRKKKWNKAGKNLSKALRSIISNVKLKGLELMFGGKNNFYTYAFMNGLREGVEQSGLNMDTSIKSNTYGNLGDYYYMAPTNFNQKFNPQLSLIEKNINLPKLGIARGELYLNWLLGRLN